MTPFWISVVLEASARYEAPDADVVYVDDVRTVQRDPADPLLNVTGRDPSTRALR